MSFHIDKITELSYTGKDRIGCTFDDHKCPIDTTF